MAKILDLKVQPRERSTNGALNRMRKEGFIPAVVYGRGFENKALKVHGKTFSQLLQQSASDHILVNLKEEGQTSDQLALVQEVQHDYLRGGLIHVDFHAVRADEEIHAGVPIILQGVDAAEKKGGMLEHILHTLDVRCLPKDLPETLTLDVAILNIGQGLHVSDLKLPEGVTTRIDGHVMVALLKEPTVAEEPEPAAAAAGAAAAPAAGAAPAGAAAKPAAGAKPEAGKAEAKPAAKK